MATWALDGSLRVWPVLGCAVLAASCSLVNAYDEIPSPSSAGGSSTSGIGGAGGAGGAGGSAGQAPLQFECAWRSSQHHEVATVDKSVNDSSWIKMVGTESSSHPRVAVVRMSSTDPNIVDIYTLDSSPKLSLSFNAAVAYQFQRLDPSHTALVYQPTSATALRLAKINDQTDADEHLPLTEDLLCEPASLNSRFTVIDTTPTIDFAGECQTTTPEPKHEEFYGRFQATPINPVTITESGLSLTPDDTDLRGLVYHNGKSHLFVGDMTSSQGSRYYALDFPVNGPLAARQISPAGSTVFAVKSRNDGINIATVETAPTGVFRAGKVLTSNLESFTFNDLPSVPGIVDIDDVPDPPASHMSWMDDVFVALGSRVMSGGTEFRYLFADNSGNLLALGTLPVNAPTGTGWTNLRIQRVFVSLAFGAFDAVGVILNVAWVMKHDAETANEGQVLYYDQITCVPLDGAAPP